MRRVIQTNKAPSALLRCRVFVAALLAPLSLVSGAYAMTHGVAKDGVTHTGYAFGPQGDAVRGLNFVRLVKDFR